MRLPYDEEAFALLDSASVKDIFKRFGEPISIKDPTRVYTRLRLPANTVYRMTYPTGVEFWMQGEKPVRIVYAKPGHFFQGKIEVGSAMEEALALAGPPRVEPKQDFWTVDWTLWQGSPWEAKNEGRPLVSSVRGMFWNEKARVCFYFREQKVNAIILLRENASTLPPEKHRSGFENLWQRSRGSAGHFSPADNWWVQWSQSRDCMTSLREIGSQLKAYSDNEEHMWFPGLDQRPGHFMFRSEDVYPRYLPDTRLLVCPRLNQADDRGDSPEASRARVNDESYWYLGHAMIDENEGLAFLEAYRDAIREGRTLMDDLEIPYSLRSGTLGKIMRIRPFVGRFYIVEAMGNPAGPEANRDIPVLVERPGHHRRQGGHVLFLDGHVEWVPYPGPFPMTEKFIQGLIALENEVSRDEKTATPGP